MNILDENVPESQRALLRSWRIAVRQIGHDLGRKGMEDEEIISLLHQLDRPTFFTLDGDFYDRRLCHEGYCLAHLDVEEDMSAVYVRRFLRHPELNTKKQADGLRHSRLTFRTDLLAHPSKARRASLVAVGG